MASLGEIDAEVPVDVVQPAIVLGQTLIDADERGVGQRLPEVAQELLATLGVPTVEVGVRLLVDDRSQAL